MRRTLTIILAAVAAFATAAAVSGARLVAENDGVVAPVSHPVPPPPVVPQPPAPEPSIFAEKGAWAVYGVHQHYGDADWHAAFARRLADQGYRWIAFPLTAGLGVSEWAREKYGVLGFYEHAGLRVCAWSGLGTQPEQEAALVRSLLLSHPLFTCYIANGEVGYITSWAGFIPGSSEAFVRGLGQVPGVELALSTAVTSAYDYAPWKAAGYHLLPQAYRCAGAGWTAILAEAVAEAAGWPLSRIHLTFGIYGFDGGCSTPLDEYLRAYVGHRTTGWNVFVADQGLV